MRYKYVVFYFIALMLLACGGTKTPPRINVDPTVYSDLKMYTQKPYVELFDIAPTLHYTSQQLDQMREYYKQSQKYCQGVYQTKTHEYDQRLRERQYDLMRTNYQADETNRDKMHCDIQNLRIQRDQYYVLSQEGIPVAYDNREAKLDLIQHWPSEYARIQQSLQKGTYRSRQWGNAQDIGFREIQKDQQDDIDDGQKAIRQMEMQRLMPPPIQNETVTKYVRNLGDKIAANSDLRVPIHIMVLKSKEINAFALPGGYLFIQRGLLEAADDEAELAGVLGHEMAHVTARHAHRLQKKANIANILYSAARVAGALSGYGGLGYALRYGGAGLGLVLNLNLLGVSRDYELEADQLGVQYTWHAGYDPAGFVRFFDKMASKKGYAHGTSWFRTHPAFYERMAKAKEEMIYLPPQKTKVVQTTEFEEMKKALKDVEMPPMDVFRERLREAYYPVVKNCPAAPAESNDGLCELPPQKTPTMASAQ